MGKQQQVTSQLYDEYAAMNYYHERYIHGYMDDWPYEKKQRIFELIRSIELPDKGDALDFGCGNGVLTNIIKQALPSLWNVYGTDISAIAIENARKNYPKITFFVANGTEFTSKKFDFIFTHHVLEHVYDLHQTLSEINGYLKDSSAMLHILPCGNEGSFEHNICRMRKDGIDPMLEARFFYEDEGHLRRLKTQQLNELFAEKGFTLTKEYYSSHYYGAINWITQSDSDFIQSLTDISAARNEKDRRKLRNLKYKLFLIWGLRYPASLVSNKLSKKHKTLRDYLILAAGLPLYLFSKPIDHYLRIKTDDEWRGRKTDQSGSEMYLYFTR
jgi:trans-aconitate methyltransferase